MKPPTENRDELLWGMVITSSPRNLTHVEGLDDVLHLVREERRIKGLTGLTIYSPSINISLVEGGRQPVHAYFKSKMFHPVIFNVKVIYDGALEQRYFEGYPLLMKVYGQSRLRKLDDFKKKSLTLFLQDFLELQEPIPAMIKNLLSENELSFPVKV